MADFAKLFTTPHGQLLVTTEEMDNDGMWPMKIRGAEVDGVGASLKPAFDAEAERKTAFDRFDQDKADEAALVIARLLRSLPA